MIDTILSDLAVKAARSVFNHELDPGLFSVQKTNKEFEGDYTIVVFPLTRLLRKPPQVIGEEIGRFMIENSDIIARFNVISGFLNLVVNDGFWKDFFRQDYMDERYGLSAEKIDPHPVVIEYSSPNTNKPLHLGHVRNNLLGFSLAAILKANGKKVVKVNLVNDRGIHICKSMLAWQKWGNGETPVSSGMKGDHLIGKYYVMFDRKYKEQALELIKSGLSDEEALRQAPLIIEAQQLLKKWEEHDRDTLALWSMMNHWAYEGFDVTYRQMGVEFDKTYYESDTYLLGKKIVEEGLSRKILEKRDDGSVWADLSENGLDQKLLIRADGTSVYITQDLGTAQQRHDECNPEKLIYVVGNEQIYHFNVLKLILKKLQRPWAENIFHLSYGMVELPQGKMKSREGTVVDADDLMEEMMVTAETMTRALGKIEDFDEREAIELYRMVGLGALKYFILKVDPMKTMTFNPEESIDFNGNTGPFIQYTYARIQSVIRKAAGTGWNGRKDALDPGISLIGKERNLLKLLYEFPSVVGEAADNYSPAVVANYVYELAKEYNQFYHDHSILKAETGSIINFRIELSRFTGQVIKSAMGLLGIEVPERM